MFNLARFFKQQMNRELLLLLTIGGLYSLGIFLSNTFVNIYLWRQSGDYVTIASYNLAIFVFQSISFIIAGKIAKKIDRIIVLRLGVIFLSIFFLLVLYIGELAASLNVLLGSILGIGYGFYWLAYNVLTFEITEPETRDFFNGFLGVLESFGGMIGPLIAGIIISSLPATIGYTVIFTLSFILFIIAVICSFFLKRRHAEGVFQFKRVLNEKRYNKNWKRILYAHIFQGLREGVFLFIIAIWVFLTTGSELSLGVFNLVFSGVAFLFYLLVTRLIQVRHRKTAILAGGFLLALSIYLILYDLTYTRLIIYATIIGMAYPMINVPYSSITYDIIGQARYAKQLRIEYIVIRELFVNIGRIISITIFLFVVMWTIPEIGIQYVLAVFSTGYLFIYLYVRKIKLHT